MSTPDRPARRGRPGVTFRYGVWVAHGGFRSEVVRDGDVWRVYAYTSLTGTRPEQISEYRNQAQLVWAIVELEELGYRYDPDRRPLRAPRQDNHARPLSPGRWRSARVVIGTALVGILLLAIEFFVLGR